VILVQLRVHRVDLSLAERIIKRVVDGRWCDAESRRSRAIDHHLLRLATQLLICDNIGQLWQLLQLCDQSARHGIQLGLVGIFHRVLILGAAHDIVDGQILHRLHVQLDALDLLQLRCQAVDDLGRGYLTDLERL